MPEDRQRVGAPAAVPRVRPRRLLRPVAVPPRACALPRDGAPHHRRLRSARGLGLVLRRRRRDRAAGPDTPAGPHTPVLLGSGLDRALGDGSDEEGGGEEDVCAPVVAGRGGAGGFGRGFAGMGGGGVLWAGRGGGGGGGLARGGGGRPR